MTARRLVTPDRVPVRARPDAAGRRVIGRRAVRLPARAPESLRNGRLAGGMSPTGWGLAFLHVAVIALVGQLAFVALRPRDLIGERTGSASR
jgi:hypothetical protein